MVKGEEALRASLPPPSPTQAPDCDDSEEAQEPVDTEQYEVIHRQRNRFQSVDDIPRPKIPQFITERKPYNKVFLQEVKRRHQIVWDHVKVYHEFIMGYDEIGSDPNLRAFVAQLIKDLITLYWDMPSSQSHHDSDHYGNLIHSLELGCIEAKRAANTNFFGESGVDSEATKKIRPYNILAGFIVGCLHDANKLFQYSLQYENDSGAVNFVPLRGTILNFMATFPTAKVSRGWRPNPHPQIPAATTLFNQLLPYSIQEQFPSIIYFDMLKRLQAYNPTSEGDIEAIAKYSKDPEFMVKFERAFYEFLVLSENRRFNDPGAKMFRLDTNWFGVFYSVIADLAHRMNLSHDSLSALLHSAGFLGATELGSGLIYGDEFVVYFDSKDPGSSRKVFLSFLRSTIVESQLQTLKTNSQDTNFVIEDNIPAASILIHPHYKPLAGRFFDLLPLRESIFGMPGPRQSASNEPEKKLEPAQAAVVPEDKKEIANASVVPGAAPEKPETPVAAAETPAVPATSADTTVQSDSLAPKAQKATSEPIQGEETKAAAIAAKKAEHNELTDGRPQEEGLQPAVELPMAAHSSGKENTAAQPYTDMKEVLANIKPPLKKTEDNEAMPPELPLRLLELLIECICCDGSIRMQDMDDSCLLVINANNHCFLKITKLVNFLLRKAVEKKILPAGFKKERTSYVEIVKIWSQEGYIDRMSEHKIFERQTLEVNLLSPSKKKYEVTHTTDNFTILNTTNLEKLASRTGRYSVIRKLNEVYKRAYPEHNSEV